MSVSDTGMSEHRVEVGGKQRVATGVDVERVKQRVIEVLRGDKG